MEYNMERLTARRVRSIGITCFLAYASCYFGKNILSAMMPELLESGVFSDEALGRMPSIFMLTYGAGQLINGWLGNRVRGRYMLSFGLLFPGVLLCLFPSCTSVLWGTVLWGACGFFSSMLWGPIARMIGENMPPAKGQLWITLMTVASTSGALATQALAVLGGVTDSYRVVFYISGGFLCIVALLVFFVTLHLEKTGAVKVERIIPTAEHRNGVGARFLTAGFVCMSVVTMLNGVVRNAVSFWIPTFLVQYLEYPKELSAGLVMLLPLFNVAGTVLTLWIFQRLRCDEKKMCATLFVAVIPLFALLYICRGSFSFLSVAALFFASALMMGVCTLVFSVYVLQFHDTGKLSGISGFYDFASYISASGASLLFNALMVGNNWNMLIALWILIGVLGALCSSAAYFFEKRKRTAQ